MARKSDRPGGRGWFSISMKDTGEREPTVAEIAIYDEIGSDWYGDGVSAKSFADQLADIDADQIELAINSPGGDAWDGLAIMNQLRRHPAQVNVTVDGLAASAASIIAMAGDHITMNRGAEMMIHDASGLCYGNATDMTETAAVLSKISDSYASAYAARTGRTREDMRALMDAETWFDAEEAVEAGLADDWVDAPAAAARFDFQRAHFKHRCRDEARRTVVASAHVRVHARSTDHPASEPEEPNKEGAVMKTDALEKGLRDRLGVADGLDADGLLAAYDAKLAAIDKTHSEALAKARSEVPEGVVAVDQEAFNQLQAAAEDGRKALENQREQAREVLIHDALADGRIAPASAAKWRALLEANEDSTAELLASLPKNSAAPVAEAGYGLNPDQDTDLYRAIYNQKGE